MENYTAESIPTISCTYNIVTLPEKHLHGSAILTKSVACDCSMTT